MILPLTAPEGDISITSLLRRNPTRKYVEKVQKYDWKCLMHNTGYQLSKAIEKFDYYESVRLMQLRQKYTPSNKDFFARLHRPIDKIFTAKGGSANYYLPDEQKKQFLNILSNISDGYSLRQWMEMMWLPNYHADPMGLIFMEIGIDNCYPTYKSSESIFAMPKPNGRKFEWLILKIDNNNDPNNTYGGARGADAWGSDP